MPRGRRAPSRAEASALAARGLGRVGERAEHARDVAQRRALAAALGERARGLALEVEHEPVAVGPQHLAEVVVAVLADRLAAGAARGAARAAARARRPPRARTASAAPPGSRPSSTSRASASALSAAPGRACSGRNAGSPASRGEHGVHARGDLAQPAQRARNGAGVGERLERELPAVARTRHERLQDAERRR